jgi:amino acid permease
LFYSIIIFVFILFLQLVILGTDEFSREPDALSTANNIHGWENTQITFSEVKFGAPTADIFTIMRSVSSCFVAFSFANNLFPIFSSLKVKTSENIRNVVGYSVGIVWFIYSFLAVVSLFLFGKSVDLDTNIMKSVNFEKKIDPARWEGNIL